MLSALFPSHPIFTAVLGAVENSLPVHIPTLSPFKKEKAHLIQTEKAKPLCVTPHPALQRLAAALVMVVLLPLWQTFLPYYKNKNC